MNFLARPHKRPAPLFEATAMVDIVFILLAFFVMASHFRTPEKDVVAGAAQVKAAGAAAADLPTEIPVRIRRAGDGIAVTLGDRTELADLEHLTATLTEINLPEITVRVAADGDVSVQQVASALEAVLASPMKTIALSRPPAADPERP